MIRLGRGGLYPPVGPGAVSGSGRQLDLRGFDSHWVHHTYPLDFKLISIILIS